MQRNRQFYQMVDEKRTTHTYPDNNIRPFEQISYTSFMNLSLSPGIFKEVLCIQRILKYF